MNIAVGLLGGTFDPPHYGHLELARAALADGRVGRVEFLPAARPPHKERPDISPAPRRLEMLRLLLAAGGTGESPPPDTIGINPVELERDGASYTIDTVRELSRRRPDVSWRLLIGSDMARDFGLWREARELMRLAPPLWAERADAPWPATPSELAARKGFGDWTAEELSALSAGRIGMVAVPVSSSRLREWLRRSDDPAHAEAGRWLPDAVADYWRTRFL